MPPFLWVLGNKTSVDSTGPARSSCHITPLFRTISRRWRLLTSAKLDEGLVHRPPLSPPPLSADAHRRDWPRYNLSPPLLILTRLDSKRAARERDDMFTRHRQLTAKLLGADDTCRVEPRKPQHPHSKSTISLVRKG